jgi:ribonuclease J
LVWCSGQNIDRICSIVKAANRARRQIIVDLYVASVLHAIRDQHGIPQPGKGRYGLKVWFAEPTWGSVRRRKHEVDPAIKAARVYSDRIGYSLADSVLVVRPSMLNALSSIDGLQEGLFVHSLWAGYADRPENRCFLDFLSGRHFQTVHIHASGHASLAVLKRVVEQVQPRKLIPIHTLHPEAYGDAFRETAVQILQDREPMEL